MTKDGLPGWVNGLGESGLVVEFASACCLGLSRWDFFGPFKRVHLSSKATCGGFQVSGKSLFSSFVFVFSFAEIYVSLLCASVR